MRTRLGPDDRGDVVLGWLTKLVATLAVVGVLGFDAVSLGSGRFQAEDHAQGAARAASAAWQGDKRVQVAYDAALAEVVEAGDTIDTIDTADFTVAADGAVTLTLHHEVSTLLVHRVAPLRDLAVLTATVTSRTSG